MPWPEISPAPPAVEVQRPNHWTARELWYSYFLLKKIKTIINILKLFLFFIVTATKAFSYTLASFVLHSSPMLFLFFLFYKWEVNWFEQVTSLAGHQTSSGCFSMLPWLPFWFTYLSGTHPWVPDNSISWVNLSFWKTPAEMSTKVELVTCYTLSPMNTSQLIVRRVGLGGQVS